MTSFFSIIGRALSLYKLMSLIASAVLLSELRVGIIFPTVGGFDEVMFLIPSISLIVIAATLPDRGKNISLALLSTNIPIICDKELLASAITFGSMKLYTGVLRNSLKVS